MMVPKTAARDIDTTAGVAIAVATYEERQTEI